MEKGHVIYRRPGETKCYEMHGEVEVLTDIRELEGKKGFVMVPFCITEESPVIVIKKMPHGLVRHSRVSLNNGTRNNAEGDAVYHVSTQGRNNRNILKENATRILRLAKRLCRLGSTLTCLTGNTNEDRKRYRDDFKVFHEAVVERRFRKIVLAREKNKDYGLGIRDYHGGSESIALEIFERACRMYKNMYVAMVKAERCGTWIMATPELLMKSEGDRGTTMALAGTDKSGIRDKGLRISSDLESYKQLEHWSEKNVEEQRIVADYIKERISKYADEIKAEGPYTVKAGELKHLRTDFEFKIKGKMTEMISDLYPTPAVCGIPKEEAMKFIIENEHTNRQYYSGFCGEWNMDSKTELYVSLRCVKIEDGGYSLYAGGGILADSDEETEWRETEAKMETIERCIR